MVLVDSSVWIEYFKSTSKHALDHLIQDGLAATNEIVLTELLPLIWHKREFELAESLQALPLIKLDIDWDGIRLLQKLNLSKGINKVGINDLIIAQNCMDNNLTLWSKDKHFRLMVENISLKLFL